MFVIGEDVVDLDLLREIANTGGAKSVEGRYPAPLRALAKAGLVQVVAVGAGGYVYWEITQKGLEQLI